MGQPPDTCPKCSADLEREPDQKLVPECQTLPGFWYCPACDWDEFKCPICDGQKADDQDICGRCYDQEHGPDEVRYASGDFPTDREVYECFSMWGARIWD